MLYFHLNNWIQFLGCDPLSKLVEKTGNNQGRHSEKEITNTMLFHIVVPPLGNVWHIV